MDSAERHRRKWTVLAVLATAFVLSSWPYSYPMSCWASANQPRIKGETMEYARRVGGNFDLVNFYLTRSDFFLRNSSAKKDGLTTYVYVTNYGNLSCWYLNIMSIDTGIVRVDVDATGKVVATR